MFLFLNDKKKEAPGRREGSLSPRRLWGEIVWLFPARRPGTEPTFPPPALLWRSSMTDDAPGLLRKSIIFPRGAGDNRWGYGQFALFRLTESGDTSIALNMLILLFLVGKGTRNGEGRLGTTEDRFLFVTR